MNIQVLRSHKNIKVYVNKKLKVVINNRQRSSIDVFNATVQYYKSLGFKL